MSFYRAIEEMFLGEDVFPGQILTPDHLAGRDVSILIRLGLVEFVNEEQPKPTPKTDEPKTEAPALGAEEAAPVVKETGPVKATVEKNGVWFQVFANGKKIFNSRKENEAKKFARDFNANL